MSNKLIGVFAVMVALLLTVSVVYANDMEIGVLGGLNIADEWGNDAADGVDNRLGLLTGGFFGMGFNENLGGRVEVLFAQKGWKVEEMGNSLTFARDYFEIPVLAVGMFPVSEAARIDIFAGPSFGFLSTGELQIDVGGFGADADVKDALLKSFDIGAVVGAGASFAAGPVNIVIQGRATIGFSNFYDLDANALADLGLTPEDIGLLAAEDPSAKNIAYGFLGGVSVPLGATE